MQKRDIGFTLVELLVSFAVIAVLATIVFVNFRSGNDILALERSAQKVVQDVRRTAGFALQGDQLVTCGSGTLSAYGIYIQEGGGSYIIFANCNGTDKEGYDSGQDTLIETVTLEDPVTILSVDAVPSAGIFNGNAWSVSFFPPDPQAVLCGNDSCNGNNLLKTAEVTIALKNDASKTKTIDVNEAGFPDLQ